MYEIARENDRVIINKGGTSIFNAPKDSYLVYEEGVMTYGEHCHATVAKVGDLPDDKLLLALTKALPLKI